MAALLEPVKLPIAKPTALVNYLIRHLMELAEFAYKKRQIVAYSGRTGIGKSTGIEWLAYHLEIPRIVLRCRAITRESQILEALALERGEKRGSNMHCGRLYDRALAKLAQKPHLLIFDEADRFRNSCFELLRDFWDDCRAPMLLVGNENLEHKIDHNLERLARRIRRYRERDLRQVELRLVLEAMGWTLADEEFDLVWKHSGGSPGWAEAVLITADAIAERAKDKRGVRDIAGAMELVPAAKRARE